ETAAIALSHHRFGRRSAGVSVRPATPEDLPAVLAFLEAVGPQRQFFPRYEPGDFFTAGGAFRDLRSEDLLLAYRGGRLAGTLAGWDQRGFRQTVVHAYRRPLRWAKPLYNGWARVWGRPRLPGAGEAVAYLP